MALFGIGGAMAGLPFLDPVAGLCVSLMIARTGLGTINHSLLTIEALRSRGISIHGMAFVGAAEEDSENTICAIGGVRRLGRLPMLESLDADSLALAFSDNFALEEFQ